MNNYIQSYLAGFHSGIEYVANQKYAEDQVSVRPIVSITGANPGIRAEATIGIDTVNRVADSFNKARGDLLRNPTPEEISAAKGIASGAVGGILGLKGLRGGLFYGGALGALTSDYDSSGKKRRLSRVQRALLGMGIGTVVGGVGSAAAGYYGTRYGLGG